MIAPLTNVLADELPGPPMPQPGERWALWLDIDGTLVDFADHPDDVHLSPQIKLLIERLRAVLGDALAILSGRTLEDVDRLLAPSLLPAGALHGSEQRDACGEVTVMAPPPAVSEALRSDCADALGRWPGVFMETKRGIALALHFRSVPQHGPSVRRFAESVASKSQGHYALQLGDCVAELKPAAGSKGTALRSLAENPPFVGRRPVVLGDDLTDESAFAQARALGGFGVIVGARRPTHAAFALSGPEASIVWLDDLARHLESDHAGRA